MRYQTATDSSGLPYRFIEIFVNLNHSSLSE